MEKGGAEDGDVRDRQEQQMEKSRRTRATAHPLSNALTFFVSSEPQTLVRPLTGVNGHVPARPRVVPHGRAPAHDTSKMAVPITKRHLHDRFHDRC